MKKKYITPLAEYIVLGTGNVMDSLKTNSSPANKDNGQLSKESTTNFNDWEDDFEEAQD